MIEERVLMRPIAYAKQVLPDLFEKYRDSSEGVLPQYIPALTRADPSHFGLSIATADGETFSAGDADVAFPMESISKPFVYALALKDLGREELKQKVGVHATGLPFDSIIDSAIRKTRRRRRDPGRRARPFRHRGVFPAPGRFGQRCAGDVRHRGTRPSMGAASAFMSAPKTTRVIREGK